MEPDYEEESMEPPAAKIDMMAPCTGIGDKDKMQHLMRMSTFNKAYMRDAGKFSERGISPDGSLPGSRRS